MINLRYGSTLRFKWDLAHRRRHDNHTFTTVRYDTVTTQHAVSSGAQSYTLRHKPVSQTVEISRNSECCVRLSKNIERVECAMEHSIEYGCKDRGCYTIKKFI